MRSITSCSSTSSTLFNHTISSKIQSKSRERKVPKPLGEVKWDFPCSIERDLKISTIEHPNFDTLDLVDHHKLKNNSIHVLATLQSFLEEDEGEDETDLDCFSILDEMEENSLIGSPTTLSTSSPVTKIVNNTSTTKQNPSTKPSNTNSKSIRIMIHKKPMSNLQGRNNRVSSRATQKEQSLRQK